MDLGYLAEDDLVEDLSVIQLDGTKVCYNWDFKGKGYHKIFLKRERKLTDEELLSSAQRDLERYWKRKDR